MLGGVAAMATPQSTGATSTSDVGFREVTIKKSRPSGSVQEGG